MILEEAGLAALRQILDGFGKISGLICNFDKTVVMPNGKRVAVPANLFGFKCENKIKLLGTEVTNSLDNVYNIFIEIGEKILNLILFWSRFRLSLLGRISIVKTLLIPQLNYVGCILSPSRQVVDNIQTLLDEFALNGLRISKDRYYLPPAEGGLGLIHIGTFLMAQKCTGSSECTQILLITGDYGYESTARVRTSLYYGALTLIVVRAGSYIISLRLMICSSVATVKLVAIF